MAFDRKRITAQRTGDADASEGGFANSGVMNVEQLVLVIQAANEPTAVTPEQAAEALRAYARRVREAYGRLDIEVLTPLSDQGEHDVVELKEVFVAPGVRADPPPVALPKELERRLAERGELPLDGTLPPGVDAEQLERARDATQRPVEPVLDVLGDEQRPRLVLLGDPGAGKSTLARYLALTLTGAIHDGVPEALRGRLPLVVELRRYAQAEWREATFERFLEHLHETEGLSVPGRVLAPLLAEGRALVIFDGLDELFDPQVRNRVAHRVAAFACKYPGVRVVVTSRQIGYQRGVLAGAEFGHYMLQDLTEKQIGEFAQRWYANACPGNAELAEILVRRITDAVTTSRSVRELAGNPLLLTILAIIGRRQTLPRDRQGVYEHAVTVLVAHWDRDAKHLRAAGGPDVREVLDHLDAADRLELLRLLARRMQNGEDGIAGNHIHAKELEDVLRDYFRQYDLPPLRVQAAARAMVQQLRERNFILSHYGGGVYGFVHRTFLEYLAASDIVHRFKDEREWTPEELVHDVFGHRATDPAWHEVLLLIIGQLSPRDAALAIDHLVDLHRSRSDQVMLVLAIRALAEVRKIGALTRESENIIDALTHHLTHRREPSAWVSSEVAPALATFSNHWVGRRRLLRWFHLHGHFVSRLPHLAMAELATILYHKRGTLTALVVHAPTTSARGLALRLLAERWGKGIAQVFEEGGEGDLGPGVREAALRWLTEHLREGLSLSPEEAAMLDMWTDTSGGEERVLLEERAVGDPEPGPRAAALGLLALRWGGEVRVLLEERAVGDPEPGPRAAALEGLAAWLYEVGELLEERAVGDPDPGPRAAALGLLARRRGGEVRVLLEERAVGDPDPGPRAAALEGLAARWPDGVRELLERRAVVDPDPEPRAKALEWLLRRWPEETRRLLRERAVNDPDAELRLNALRSWVVASDDAEGAELLKQRMREDPSGTVRAGAAWTVAFWWYRDEPMLDVLRGMARDDVEEGVREQVTAALAAARAMREQADHEP
ncbi:NACHT domain-containing protein [Streptomyces sp. 4N509B]|uniref:NACHT domain-containing protein n=1 Tax=Streptomyces sp. 4N509B TaxID=3457413 RepID=UPI003FD6ACA1